MSDGISISIRRASATSWEIVLQLAGRSERYVHHVETPWEAVGRLIEQHAPVIVEYHNGQRSRAIT